MTRQIPKSLKTLSLTPLLLLLLISNLNAEVNKIAIPLREFALNVASYNKVNILIQESIDDEKVTFMVGDKDNSIYLPAFKKMLFLKGFDFKEDKKNNFYFIEKIPEKEKEEKKEPEPIKDVFHSVTLKNLVFPDVENLLKLHNATYSYIASTNTVAFFCKPEHLETIKTSIKALDVPYSQVQFKITLLETNLNDIRDRGVNLSAYAQSINTTNDETVTKQSFNYFLNLITMPYTAQNNVIENSKSGFYGVLKYLDQNGITKIEDSPVISARSHTEATFSNVKNVRYIVNTSSYSQASTTSQNSYQYKDVGTKIIIKPFALGQVINFNLSLTVESILAGEDSGTPTTSKKELTGNFDLKRGEILVLSGINSSKNLDNSFGVPLIQDLWFVGNFFKYESKTETKSVITITIEVL